MLTENQRICYPLAQLWLYQGRPLCHQHPLHISRDISLFKGKLKKTSHSYLENITIEIDLYKETS